VKEEDGELPKRNVREMFRYGFVELVQDISKWLIIGMLVAALLAVLIPQDFFTRQISNEYLAMLMMLAASVPLYICATASTPIAAALILKGVSPGAALVFLLAGPATNVTSLTVLLGILGKRATVVYLAMIAVFTVLFGLAVDQVYGSMGISARAMVGQAAEWVPDWAQWLGAMTLLLLSARPVSRSIRAKLGLTGSHTKGSVSETEPSEAREVGSSDSADTSCGCSSGAADRGSSR
jgi:hypothetical protein